MGDMNECPFCGCTTIKPATTEAGDTYHCCDWCGAEGPIEGIVDGMEQGWNRRAIPAADALDERDALRAKVARIASAWPIVRDADCSGGTLASAMDEIEAAISDGAADEATEASAALAEFHAKGGKTLDEIARAIPAAIADGGKDA